MPLRNPTRAEKQVYREKIQRGQGIDLEPKDSHEIHRDKKPYMNEDEERRLDASKNLQYRSYDRGLGGILRCTMIIVKIQDLKLIL